MTHDMRHMTPDRWREVNPFTKPPLLQESRLTGGGSPNLMVLVEWKVPVESKTIGAKPNLCSFATELVCAGSPIACALVEWKAPPQRKVGEARLATAIYIGVQTR